MYKYGCHYVTVEWEHLNDTELATNSNVVNKLEEHKPKLKTNNFISTYEQRQRAMRIPHAYAVQLLIMYIILPVTALLDCYHGFVGRMQASVEDRFIPVNETRVCAAYLCIKVIVHAGIDDDNVFQQGISSRCGYTGGDRAACSRIDGCAPISVFDGMNGNFSFCCCHTPNCNKAMDGELESIYAETRRKKDVATSPSTRCSYLLLFFILLTRLLC